MGQGRLISVTLKHASVIYFIGLVIQGQRDLNGFDPEVNAVASSKKPTS